MRSQTPELVRQEVWGLLLAHYAVRGLMHEAALQADEDPDWLSFLHAVRVIRRHLPRFAVFPLGGVRRCIATCWTKSWRNACKAAAAGKTRAASNAR